MEPIDYLAFIGHNPFDHDNIYVATGDSGMGLTHGTIAGMLLCDLILGRPNPWAKLYSPARVPVKAAGEPGGRDAAIDAPRDEETQQRRRHNHAGREPHRAVYQQPGDGKGRDTQRDAAHRREAHGRPELLLGEPALREVDRVRRSAGPEERAGDTAAQAGEPGPTRVDESSGTAVHEAVERVAQHE